MTTSASASLRPSRRTLGELVALSLICALAYGFGLADHGVTNWQEGIRLLAAREMQDSGSWAVPTIHGEPYLAKPPMIYWVQLGLARLADAPVSLVHLRLTVALAGWAGVIATWWAARRLLRDDTQPDPNAEGGAAWADRAAFWAAAMMATGILLARSARIGELDILLVAPTALTILGAFEALRATRRKRAARAWAWAILACLAIAFASLSKGPPGMLTALVAILGGCWAEAARGRSIGAGGRWAIAAIMIACAVVLAIYRAPGDIKDGAGLALFIAFAGIIAAMVARIANRASVRAFVRDTLRSRWPLIAVVGFAALAVWGRFVSAAAPDAASAAVSKELAENLSPLVAEAPVRGLEVLAYGAGLGSICAIIGLIWILRDRPRLPTGMLWVFAWIVGAWIVFTVGGRGTHRYLVPALPGVAILGGAWVASWMRDRATRRAPAVAATAIVALALTHAWWYGIGRDRYFADRSPRDFVAELAQRAEFAGAPVASWEFWKPGLEVYAATRIEMISDRPHPMEYPRPPVPRGDVRELIASRGGRCIILARAGAGGRGADPTPADELRALGFDVRDLGIAAPFLIDRDRVSIVALEVRAGR